MTVELPPAPQRIARRPRDKRGYPVPWFVHWIDGEPDFRVVDTAKWVLAVKDRRCWVCGEKLGRNIAFVIGPMCAVNRVTSEPGCHLECATWSAQACPFLSRPRMRRNEKGLPENKIDAAGFPLDRNPGGCVVWVTRGFKTFKAHEGNSGWLITLDEPTELHWFVEGRKATRDEVIALMERGIPTLRDMAAQEGQEAVQEVEAQYAAALRDYVPKAA